MAPSLASRFALLARPRRPESLPVALDRRRIYVLPTRFGLFFAALVFTMLLGALNYNNNPALLLALLLGATALASLISRTCSWPACVSRRCPPILSRWDHRCSCMSRWPRVMRAYAMA